MPRDVSRLAIPIFRSRVAPVLNWCSKILILGENDLTAAAGQEILLLNMSAFDRLRILVDEGIRTLICGALSPDLLSYGQHLGLLILPGVSGDIEEVIRAYRANELNQQRFWLPGRTGRRDFSSSCPNGSGGDPANLIIPSEAKHSGRIQENSNDDQAQKIQENRPKNQKRRSRGGRGGFFTCPQCGLTMRREPSIPSSHIYCPQCDLPMKIR